MYSTKSKFQHQKCRSVLALQVPFSFIIKTVVERTAKLDTLLTVFKTVTEDEFHWEKVFFFKVVSHEMDHCLTHKSNTPQHTAVQTVLLDSPVIIFTNKAFSRVCYM